MRWVRNIRFRWGCQCRFKWKSERPPEIPWGYRNFTHCNEQSLSTVYGSNKHRPGGSEETRIWQGQLVDTESDVWIQMKQFPAPGLDYWLETVESKLRVLNYVIFNAYQQISVPHLWIMNIFTFRVVVNSSHFTLF